METNRELVRQENETTGRGVIEESPLSYRVSHLVVRVIATINVVHLLLGYYPPYFQAELRVFPGAVDIYWMLASSLLIPLYVGFETWWMFRAQPSQKRAIMIDWLFATVWFVLWWIFMLRSLYVFPSFLLD